MRIGGGLHARKRRTGRPTINALALGMLALPLGPGPAGAELLAWASDTATCYDDGVYARKPIVILFYDKRTSRVGADALSTRLSLSPRMQAVAAAALWCFADVSSDIVARNIGKALRVGGYPSVSVLAPNGSMLDRSGRATDFDNTFLETKPGFEETAERYILRHIESVAAKYRRNP